jgi:hypothetical protein
MRWLAVAALAGIAHGGDAVAFRLDAKTTFQTWEGWSCVPNPAGYERAFVAWLRSPTPETYDRVPMRRDLPSKLISRIHDALVSELGITRVRIEVGPQVEMVNDNADPRKTDASRYRFLWQDDQIERHVLPLKERIEARGERMTIYVSYDLRSKLTPAFLLEPGEYAEMAAAFLAHAKERYGIEPDYWSVLNEPGNDRPGDPGLCAELTAAAGTRIAEAGFRTRMSGPECVTVAQADRYLRGMEGVPGALDRFAQITYHLYHGGAEDVAARNAVRDWARKLKITAAQTEWMEAKDLDVARHIHLCLTEADAVAWDRFGADLFFDLPYRDLTDAASDGREPGLSSTAWHIRQFSRFIRPGAVRVGLAGGSDAVKGVAFLRDGMAVVVLLNTSGEAQAVEIHGLKPGRYGRCFTSAPQRDYGRRLPEVAVTENGGAAFDLMPRSVTTLADAGE